MSEEFGNENCLICQKALLVEDTSDIGILSCQQGHNYCIDHIAKEKCDICEGQLEVDLMRMRAVKIRFVKQSFTQNYHFL